MTLVVLPFWVLFSFITPAKADCACLCVDGVVQGICSSSMDVQPVCAPKVCPVVPPSVEPIQVDPVPPPNSEDCEQYEVWNDAKEEYEYKNLCQ